MTAKKARWLHTDATQILDAVVDAILTIDTQGTILSANVATVRLFGYDEGELLGQPLSMLMPEPYSSLHDEYVQSYMRSHVAKIIGIGRELFAQKKNGEVFPIYLAVSEIKEDAEVYFAGIIRDLTEQKAAQEALLEQREKLSQVARLSTMGEMTASIAHEINQPLTAIAMYAQASIKMLAMTDFDREKLQSALEKLSQQALRAGSVIERIQRFVRQEDGERQYVDLNQLVGELAQLSAGDARMHGIELVIEAQEELPLVFCDPIQIQQVALNLIRNAIDAMDDIGCSHGNQVWLRTSASDGMVELSVVDCGPGVAEDQMDLVFSAFHTTKKEGMGMGLSICKSIVEDHEGVLDFRNNEVGNGCTFFFRLAEANHE